MCVHYNSSTIITVIIISTPSNAEFTEAPPPKRNPSPGTLNHTIFIFWHVKAPLALRVGGLYKHSEPVSFAHVVYDPIMFLANIQNPLCSLCFE